MREEQLGLRTGAAQIEHLEAYPSSVPEFFPLCFELPDVEIVDRFGELHLPSVRNENEQLWSDAFETVSRNTPAIGDNRPHPVSTTRCRTGAPDERGEVRNQRARPLLGSLRQWFETTLFKLSRKGPNALPPRIKIWSV